jgi:H+/Cl- antiporter ClcA
MIYVKSLLAGVAALIAYYFLFVTVGMRLLLPMPPDLPGGPGYVSSSPWVPLWLILVIALLVFAGVYFWTFRELSKTSQRPRSR